MTKVVFVAKPNNPTAMIVTRDEVGHFMSRVPERTIVVFDEAYIEFAMGPDFPDTLALVKRVKGRRPAYLLQGVEPRRTARGVRGRRRGRDRLMNRNRKPFNVNSLAQVAGLAALDDVARTWRAVRMIGAGRHFLYDEFKRMGSNTCRRARIHPGRCRTQSPTSIRSFSTRGIVRPMTPFGLEKALRTTFGTPRKTASS